MIGVSLVVFVTVFAAGWKTSIADQFDRTVRADMVLRSSQWRPLPPAARAAAASVPGVGAVADLTSGRVRVGRGEESLTGVDPAAWARVYRFDWLSGFSDAGLTDWPRAGRWSSATTSGPTTSGWARSSRSAPGTGARCARRSSAPTDRGLLGSITVGAGTYARLVADHDPWVTLVDFAPGADRRAATAGVVRATNPYPDVDAKTRSAYLKDQKQDIDLFLALLYVLLALSVVSLFGMVNTLVLSTFERTREIGMLRAVGMSRRQVRRVVRYESVITAVIGAVLGTAVGLLFGWAVTRSLENEGLAFSLPGPQLVVILVVAVAAGVVAAVLPARRAARLDVLQALQYE